jgi:steroid 5-alpha reductase family enzyme
MGLVGSVVFLNGSDDSSSFAQKNVATDIIGLMAAIIGFLFETIADQQKFFYRFYTVKEFIKDNPGKVTPIMDSGLWKYSRQPNYFGEILFWWGMFVLCLHDSGTYEYASLVSPIFTSLILIFLSGIPTSEKANQKRYMKADDEAKNHYLNYREKTSPLIPLPPTIYEKYIPMWIKRVFLLELPFYDIDVKEHDSQ